MKKVIVALDTHCIQTATQWSKLFAKEAFCCKVGLEFFAAHGLEGVKRVSEFCPVFLDLKLHDIPNTVSKTLDVILESVDVKIITIHALGGPEMIAKAAQRAKERTSLACVTILTSIDEISLKQIGFNESSGQSVLKLCELINNCELKMIVASALECQKIKARFPDFKVITPGIRLLSSSAHDQKRTLTPAQAIGQGADYLVIGRPITQSDNPLAELQKINEDILKI